MGFFDKIKKGLQKTKESISKKFFEVFKAKELNDEFYEELESALISADMGVTATEQIIDELKVPYKTIKFLLLVFSDCLEYN